MVSYEAFRFYLITHELFKSLFDSVWHFGNLCYFVTLYFSSKLCSPLLSADPHHQSIQYIVYIVYSICIYIPPPRHTHTYTHKDARRQVLTYVTSAVFKPSFWSQLHYCILHGWDIIVLTKICPQTDMIKTMQAAPEEKGMIGIGL